MRHLYNEDKDTSIIRTPFIMRTLLAIISLMFNMYISTLYVIFIDHTITSNMHRVIIHSTHTSSTHDSFK